MSARNNLDKTYLPLINDHARTRWGERTPAELRLEEAWCDATPVSAPDARCSDARLYEPYDMLLVVRDGWLRTVLHNDGRLDFSGLVVCSGCEALLDPVTDDRCSGCGESLPAERQSGAITLIRGGDDDE